jgi:cellulose synthase/poly-beta-1,6-N-acetylglucosamine synthase-like glycosyltransferase
MTGHIIDPMWFYWMQLFDSLKVLAVVLGCILMVIYVPVTVSFIFEPWAWDFDGKHKGVKRLYHIGIVVLVILVALAVALPSKETMIQMKIAEYATYENIESVITEIEETAEKIMGADDEG